MTARLLSVTATPTSRLLTSQTNVKTDLGQIAADTAIDRFIDQVTDEIVAWLGYPEANGGDGHGLAQASYQETIRLSAARPQLLLSRRWLLANPTVTEDGVAVSASDIEADLSAGVVWRLSGDARINWTASKIVLTYSSGFKLPGDPDPTAPSKRAPKQIERAAVDLLAYRYSQATGEPCGRPFESINLPGAGTLNFADPASKIVDGMPDHVARLLAPFVFPVFGWE